jgi:hypothetical protein
VKQLKIVCPAIPFQTNFDARQTICDKLKDVYGYTNLININYGEQNTIEITLAMLSRFTSADAKKRLPPFKVHLFEVIGPSDPRAALFDAAKQNEIRGLIERSTWNVVLKDKMPENSNVIGDRFVLRTKDSGTNNELFKPRYVVQGFRDRPASFKMHLHRSSLSDPQRFLGIGFIQQTSLEHICKAQSR